MPSAREQRSAQERQMQASEPSLKTNIKKWVGKEFEVLQRLPDPSRRVSGRLAIDAKPFLSFCSNQPRAQSPFEAPANGAVHDEVALRGQRIRDARCKARIVFDKRDVGRQAAAGRQFENFCQEKWRQGVLDQSTRMFAVCPGSTRTVRRSRSPASG